MANPTPVPQPPYKIPISNSNGTISTGWANWFVTLYQRVGGTSALNNVDLATVQTAGIALINTEIAALQALTTTQATQITALQNQVSGLGVGRQL